MKTSTWRPKTLKPHHCEYSAERHVSSISIMSRVTRATFMLSIATLFLHSTGSLCSACSFCPRKTILSLRGGTTTPGDAELKSELPKPSFYHPRYALIGIRKQGDSAFNAIHLADIISLVWMNSVAFTTDKTMDTRSTEKSIAYVLGLRLVGMAVFFVVQPDKGELVFSMYGVASILLLHELLHVFKAVIQGKATTALEKANFTYVFTLLSFSAFSASMTGVVKFMSGEEPNGTCILCRFGCICAKYVFSLMHILKSFSWTKRSSDVFLEWYSPLSQYLHWQASFVFCEPKCCDTQLPLDLLQCSNPPLHHAVHVCHILVYTAKCLIRYNVGIHLLTIFLKCIGEWTNAAK